MKKFFKDQKDYKTFLVILSFTLIFHIACIKFYPVNDEFIFPLGAKLIETGDINLIKFYFDFNANTLGFSFVIWFLGNLFKLDYYIIGKLLSTLGNLLIVVGVLNLIKFLQLKKKINISLLIIVLLLNPLIFNFSLRSTPDFFSMSLAFFSLSFLINKTHILMKIFAIIFFSVAIIMKPFNSILLLLLLLKIDNKNLFIKENLKIIYTLIYVSILPILFFIINKHLFNFYLIPQKFNLQTLFEIKNYTVHFISYIGIFNIFLFTLYINSFFLDLKKNPFKYLFYLIVAFASSKYFLFRVGEVDFGFLSKIINDNFFYFIIGLNFLIFIDKFLRIYREKKIFHKEFIIYFSTIFIFFLILSNYLPVQRYLLTILPISILFFYLIYKKKYEIYLTIIIYFITNTLIFSNHYFTQKNIKDVLHYIKKENIINETHPSFLGQHALNYFINPNNSSKFILDEKTLFDENKKYFISEKYIPEEHEIIFKTKSKNFIKKNKNLYILKKR